MMNQGIYKNNSSGYKGVHWDERKNKWVTQIQAEGKRKYVGAYRSLRSAVLAYNKAAKTHYQEFARINSIAM
jgi:hypothetical protein